MKITKKLDKDLKSHFSFQNPKKKKKTKWSFMVITYWTDKPEETRKRAMEGICGGGYEHLVDDIAIFKDSIRLKNFIYRKRKWWEFWK